MKNIEPLNMTGWQILSLTILRITIGWHFLYEGLIKVFNPEWSAISYLNNATGPFASIFNSLASNSAALGIMDALNQWGLVLIGLSLMIGLLSRWAAVGGMALLALYYFANPPFKGLGESSMAEGNYLIVNKNLIEIFALWVIFQFPGSKLTGIDRFLNFKWSKIKN
ncbi:DoxX family membrane protein [Bacteroidota bacterium]